ncbi:MAG: HAMP domain-containing protein, partial [Polyangiales bacterium]
SMRNYLLDAHFQLKYTSYIVGLTCVVSAALGGLLYHETSRSVQLGAEAVEIGDDANRAGAEAVAQSKALSTVIEGFAETNYKSDPAMLATMKEADAAKQAEIDARAKKLEEGDKKLKEKSAALAHQRNVFLAILTGALSLLVVLVGLAGIVITHKVAGPVFKMKRLLREVGEGRLIVPPGRLRKGDELQDFFDVFAAMVTKLRERQSIEIEMLDAVLEESRASSSSPATIARLGALRTHMQGELDRT